MTEGATAATLRGWRVIGAPSGRRPGGSAGVVGVESASLGAPSMTRYDLLCGLDGFRIVSVSTDDEHALAGGRGLVEG